MKKHAQILKTSIAYCLFLVVLTSCTQRTDFTNPRKVLESYFELMNANDFDALYNVISAQSREHVTKDEFVRHYQMDSATTKIEVKSLSEVEVDKNYPNYKRFKVELAVHSKFDTVNERHYYTLVNEDNNWKVIWSVTLEDLAKRQYEKGLYSEAIKSYEKILDFNPFYANAFSMKAWCFKRDKSLSFLERKTQISENAKKALALEPDISEHYNTVAMYYGFVGVPELEIENRQKAIIHSLSNKEKSILYSNIASTYFGWNKLDSANLFINKAIALDSNDTFSWMRRGRILYKKNLRTEAQIAFERALNLPEMETALQSDLYFSYAEVLNSLDKVSVAHEYILKALELDPNSSVYQKLYKDIQSKAN